MQNQKIEEKPKTQPVGNPADTEPKTVAAVPLSKERLPDPEPATKQAVAKETAPESSAAVEAESEPKKAVPAANSPECKEALNEKELALASTENSDKLFHLRRALRLCPTNAALHYELGNTYAAMERTSNAEEEYKQALSIDPSMAAAKNALADLLKNETKF
jgi:Flp pilus assembly protein TadD